MLDFNNTEIAFSAKSQSELKNAYLLFNTIKYPWLVKCASVVSNIALNIHFPQMVDRLCTVLQSFTSDKLLVQSRLDCPS